MDQQAEKHKTERVTGLDRRTREEIAKWNQMTALRFQTRGGGDIRHPTSLASLPGGRSNNLNITLQAREKVLSVFYIGEDGGGLFLACKDFGRMFDNSFLACALFFKVEINLRTLIPLFRPGSVHSGSAS